MKNQDNKIEDLFAIADETKSNVRKLDKTAALVSISDNKAQLIIKASTTDPELKELVKTSFTQASAQDQLIDKFVDAEAIESDHAILAGCDDNEFDRLLKSQQSKRTRSKHDAGSMTVAEYLKLMSSAYAERLIRSAWNKPKNAKAVGSSELSEDDIVVLQADPEALSRKIRSLQSKTCLLRQRADFTTEPQQKIYHQTLAEIEKLQGLRPNRTVGKVVIKDDPKMNEVRELLKTDISTMSEADKDEMLKRVMSMLG